MKRSKNWTGSCERKPPMKSRSIVILILLIFSSSARAAYNIAHLQSEEPPPPSPFEIARIEADGERLRLFLSTENIAGVQTLLETGNLIAQVSEHREDDGTFWEVGLSLRQAVVCAEGAKPLYLALADPLPEGCMAPISIEYFCETQATLGPGRDLAIGYDPHHLWLVEEK
jgi:hypothetical protein